MAKNDLPMHKQLFWMAKMYCASILFVMACYYLGRFGYRAISWMLTEMIKRYINA
ncbi:MAG: hypothetical protein VXZ73_04170 [Pseudomonadota bacterium]|nr:hypothetical protein [Pseudomonadota bacterium]MEC8977406.1 hypothetical protein [Pseudomonadota bacterium]